MNRYLSLRLVTSALGASALVGAALLTRRPALVALAVAVAVVPVIGVVVWRWPELELDTGLSVARVVEGDELAVLVTVRSDVFVPWVEVELEPAPGLRSVDGVVRRVVTVPAGGGRVVAFPVQPTAWGVLASGRVRVVARDRFGLFVVSTIRTMGSVLRVYPAEVRLRTLVRPAQTDTTLGSHLSLARGDGCEYADVRQWQPGDRLRAVNWRVSARRASTWVTERHPERAADAAVVLDDTAAVGPAEDTTLRRAVQAAMALCESHLLAQDRVGLLAVGAPLRWIRPGSGPRQLYAIVDTLLDCRTARLGGLAPQGAPLGVGLRPGSTIVALSLLADDRIVEALGELRRHGHRVIVVEPLPPSPGPEPAADPSSLSARLALRVWDASRERRRDRLRAHGIVVLAWDGEVPLGPLLARAGQVAGRAGRTAGAG